MIKKVLVFLLFVLITPIISGVYGIIHDQITCTISPEYYTKFKFHQFGIDYLYIHSGEIPLREGAAIVGFMATWWVGIPIGLAIGIMSLFFKANSITYGFKSILIVFFTAILMGVVGYLVSYFFLDSNNYINTIPVDVTEPKKFLNSGMIHNFSYLGGALGLVFAIIYLIRTRLKINTN